MTNHQQHIARGIPCAYVVVTLTVATIHSLSLSSTGLATLYTSMPDNCIAQLQTREITFLLGPRSITLCKDVLEERQPKTQCFARACGCNPNQVAAGL